ncbi:MAG TPA: JAB domain-containing protein [Methylophaga aminisulfidivorans]|uniref:RadC family protein n=1 Tax=Methylophaga TaxID=40222 RepID=UPI0017776BE0|nr:MULTISPECIES: DNA repair protein RadC [Methylophaga]HIC45168.1 JAB domain-containing protein [Methylophaga sp.]HIM38390.1 JAB domain-containing protein [Methylophaga aminisulfidivorans]
MAIKDWPADDRPREKLLLSGAKALSDAELLAIFLRTGVKGFSAVDLARKLIHEFGSLRQLLEADQQQFCEGHGLGQAKYVQLQAVLEMGRRHLESSLKHGDAFTDADNTMRYIKQRLRAYPHEVFACLYLDNQHRFLSFDELFRGTIDGASVYPREVVKAALKHNAAAIILAHNHPSGVAEPSQADIHITKRIKSALDLVDIRVLDHIIVGDADVTSLAQRGCI